MNTPSHADGTVQIDVSENYPEIRDLVRRICADFGGSYWQKLEEAQRYPKEFVDALIRTGRRCRRQ